MRHIFCPFYYSKYNTSEVIKVNIKIDPIVAAMGTAIIGSVMWGLY
jgi:hypothetical protein